MPIIYCGAEGSFEAVVDDIDYEYLNQWCWNCFTTKYGMIYARRKDNSKAGKGRTILMHVAVMERTGIIKPSRVHTVDHLNRDTLFNTRGNLQWATKLQQNLNRVSRFWTSKPTHSSMDVYPNHSPLNSIVMKDATPPGV